MWSLCVSFPKFCRIIPLILLESINISSTDFMGVLWVTLCADTSWHTTFLCYILLPAVSDVIGSWAFNKDSYSCCLLLKAKYVLLHIFATSLMNMWTGCVSLLLDQSIISSLFILCTVFIYICKHFWRERIYPKCIHLLLYWFLLQHKKSCALTLIAEIYSPLISLPGENEHISHMRLLSTQAKLCFKNEVLEALAELKWFYDC